MINLIIVKRDKVIILNPMGAHARKIISFLKEKYGIEGEVKEIFCG